MTWTDCDLIEVDPAKMGGEPVIRGTRVRAQTIVNNHAAGLSIEELENNWPTLPKATIAGIIEFHHSHSLNLR